MTENFSLAANVLLARRLRNLVRVDENIEIDKYYITCAEYQLFIDEKLETGQNYQPDHWVSHKFSPGNATNPVAGVRASDAEEFCEWLTNRNLALNVRYRLPTPDEANNYLEAEKQEMKEPIGYWCKAGEIKIIMGIPLKKQTDWYQNLISALDSNFKSLFDLNNSIVKKIGYTINIPYAYQTNFVNSLFQTPNLPDSATLDKNLINAIKDFFLHYDIEDLGEIFRLLIGKFMSTRARTNFSNTNLMLKRYIQYEVINFHYFCSVYILFDFLCNLYKYITKRKLSQGYNTILSPIEYKRLSYDFEVKRNNIFDLVFYFLLINERREGRIPPWEGIKIVREKS